MALYRNAVSKLNNNGSQREEVIGYLNVIYCYQDENGEDREIGIGFGVQLTENMRMILPKGATEDDKVKSIALRDKLIAKASSCNKGEAFDLNSMKVVIKGNFSQEDGIEDLIAKAAETIVL